MNSIEKTLEADRIVPVVVIDNADTAVDLANALLDAGIHTIEITLRTAAGIDAIRRVAQETDICVGAGTVLSVEDCQRAIDAGAQFVISPGTHEPVVRHACAQGVPIFPGVITPSDIDRARALGLRVLKFFPAEAAGGAAFLKAISAPYGDIRFIPTGGIHADNLAAYLKLPSVLACGSSWFVEAALIRECNWKEIKQRAQKLLSVASQS